MRGRVRIEGVLEVLLLDRLRGRLSLGPVLVLSGDLEARTA
jgi:hypothetical protein